MEEITRYHEYLLAERTHVRNDKSILQWMRKCWKLATHASPLRMTATEYDELYATLLCEMTICWEDELGSAILEKMRRRDMSAFADLNFDRFCCSLFFFAEMVCVVCACACGPLAVGVVVAVASVSWLTVSWTPTCCAIAAPERSGSKP